MTKVLVIGLDGATWDLIKAWVDNDKLPTIKTLMEKGVYGDLESTVPPTSPSAWTSAFTGMNPGKHNIFDFISYNEYEKRVVSNKTKRAKSVWHILSSQNKSVIVVNVPKTYPPDKVNGVMISGMGTPSMDTNFTYPKKLKNDSLLRNYVIEFGSREDWITDGDKYFKNIEEMIEKRKKISLDLIKEYDWDLSIIVFVSTDRVQHIFWKYIDPDHPLYNERNAKKYKSYMLELHQRMDDILREFLDRVDDETNVIIMSDHGFGPVYKYFYINNYFESLGLLKLKKKYNTLFRKVGITKNKIRSIELMLTKIGFRKINTSKKSKRKFSFTTRSEVMDWSKTKVWADGVGSARIRINLKGKYPQGIIKQGKEYEDLRDFVIKKLHDFIDPETGKKIVKRVYRKEEVYKGNYVDNAPDMVAELEGEYAATSDFGKKLLGVAKEWLIEYPAAHRPNGIFLAYGPDIKKGVEIQNAKIYDITPTILHILRIPIPKDMDGRILREIFKKDSELAQRETRYQEHDEKKQIKEKIKKIKSQGKI